MAQKYGLGTKAVRSGHDPYEGALTTSPVVAPVHMSSTFAFDTVEHHQDSIFGGLRWPMYTRAASGNPTLRMLEGKLADLYGAEAALATSSGMAAINYTLVHLLNPGDHAVIGRCYRLTANIAQMVLGDKMNVDTTLMLSDDVKDLEKFLTDRTKVLHLDVPSNPMLSVYDIEAAAKIAHERGITVVLDDTCASPVNLRPFDLGVDVVACSLTKYMCGHGDAIGGAIISSYDFVQHVRKGLYPRFGAAMSPFNAWLIAQGLKTLHLRVPRHNQTTQALAEYLQGHPKVSHLFYPGLSTHPQHELAARMMTGCGGLMSFVVKGGDENGTALANHLRLCKIGTSFGQAETMVETGWMSHYEWSTKERVRFGILPGFVRVAPGLEDAEDLIADFEQALAQIEVNENTPVWELPEEAPPEEAPIEYVPTLTTME